MKKVFSGFVIFLVAIILVACSGTKTKDEGAGASKKEPEMVPYKAVNGTIQIPKNPKRVVISVDSYAGHALQLGVKPVGLSSFALSNKYFGDRIEGIEDIGSEESPEKILSLKPDLIITYAQSKRVKELEKIAPTIAVNVKKENFKKEVLMFGKILNKEKEAQQWVDQWNEKVEKYKPEVKKIVGNKTVSILGIADKEVYAYGDNFSRGGEIIYGEFGLNMPKLIKDEMVAKGLGYASLSLEKLPEYAGDYLFIESGENYTKTTNTNLWKQLPAVKNNHVFVIDETDSYFSDPISLDQQLESIVDNLKKTKEE